MRHPEVASRDCNLCQKFLFDEDTGRMITRPSTGEPMRRPPNTAPCRIRNGRCPKGTPEQSRELSSQNDQAYAHYLECRAVGQWPGDAIVRQNAAIIRAIEDRITEERRREEQQQMLANLVQLTRLR